MITVYHLDYSKLSDEEQLHVRIFPDSAAMNRLFELGKYTKVAEVDSDNLELAFELTNHIDRSWTENKNVKSLVDNPRSTSVGDMMELDGRRYMVDSVGFAGPITQ